MAPASPRETPAAFSPLNRFEQLMRLNRLGDVTVHAGGQAAFAVPLHGMGRHRDDRHMVAGQFSRPRMAPVASKPSISGICTSMRIRSNDSPLPGINDCLPAVAGHHERGALLFQQAERPSADSRRCLRPAGSAAAAQDQPPGPDGRRRRSAVCESPQQSRMLSNNSDCFAGFSRYA